jgi:hypothetical protein
MRAIGSLLGIVAAMWVGGAVAEEGEKPWSVDANVAFMSDYMFRGQNLYDGTSIQPYIGGSYDTGFGMLGAYNWMHISADGATNVPEFFEMDWGLSYEIAFDPVTVAVGNLWYTYPNDDDDIKDTSEGFLTVSLDDSGFNDFYTLSPTISVYKDWDEFDYYYYELKFSHDHTWSFLGDGVTITPYVSFGFVSDGEKAYAEDGLVTISEGISLDIPLGELTLAPTINYTHESDDLAVDQFWFGVTVGYSM